MSPLLQFERHRIGVTSNTAFREASILGDIDVVQNVILLRAGPGNLGDRHYYSPQALEDAVARKIFEGAQAYLNHPSTIEEQTRPERSVKDLAGWYSDVECREYADPIVGKTVALFATFHPAVGKDDVVTIIRTCVEYAKRYPRMAWAGLSINAAGESKPDTIDGEQWNRVDRIDVVESVDIVTRAGAGGTLVALKESNRMKKTGATEADVKLTLDADAVRDGVKKLIETSKTTSKAAITKVLEAAGVKLTPEQDDEMDRQLGVVDGGALDKVLDDATGVDEETEDDPNPLGSATNPAAGDGADADIEAMPDDPKFLKAQLKKERGARKEAQEKARTAESRATESTRAANTVVREKMAENVMTELNIPETFRPRLKQELVERAYPNESTMRTHAQAFDKAFIRPTIDGAGLVESGVSRDRKAVGGNFNFEEA